MWPVPSLLFLTEDAAALKGVGTYTARCCSGEGLVCPSPPCSQGRSLPRLGGAPLFGVKPITKPKVQQAAAASQPSPAAARKFPEAVDADKVGSGVSKQDEKKAAARDGHSDEDEDEDEGEDEDRKQQDRGRDWDEDEDRARGGKDERGDEDEDEAEDARRGAAPGAGAGPGGSSSDPFASLFDHIGRHLDRHFGGKGGHHVLRLRPPGEVRPPPLPPVLTGRVSSLFPC